MYRIVFCVFCIGCIENMCVCVHVMTYVPCVEYIYVCGRVESCNVCGPGPHNTHTFGKMRLQQSKHLINMLTNQFAHSRHRVRQTALHKREQVIAVVCERQFDSFP